MWSLGLYKNEFGTCKVCPQGSYNGDEHATECTPCPGGLTSKGGAGSISDCSKNINAKYFPSKANGSKIAAGECCDYSMF